jgi:hypothetical protein
MVWLGGLAALLALAGAVVAEMRPSSRLLGRGAFSLSFGLLVLALAGVAFDAEHWLASWTFGFACGFLALGISITSPRMTSGRPHRQQPAS